MAEPKPTEMIPVVDPDTGKVGYIDPKFAPEASRTGLRGATDKELRGAQVEANKAATRADLEKKYDGTIEGAIAPALAGVARGATLGLSDAAASKLGDGVRRRLLDYQQYAPISSAIGEIGGIAGTALLGDEAGLANLPGTVGRIGEGLGAGATRALGEGALARVGGAAVRGATEGAIYNAGRAAGDAALRDEDITAEKIVAAGVHGLAAGAAVGGGLGLLGVGASKLAGGSRRLAEDEGSALAASETSAASTSKPSGLGDLLQREADAKTIKALGGSTGDLRALERNVDGGFRRVAQDIRSDVEASTGKSIGMHSRESLHEYATARVEELGDRLGGMLKKLDDAKAGIAPDVNAFASKVRSELVEPNLVPLPGGGAAIKPGAKEIVHAAESWLGEVEGAFGHKPPSFTEWQKARVALQDKINYAARQATPEQGALKQIRSLMEKELETSGEAAAKVMGGSFADQYQATKSLYQSVRKAAELTERGVAAQRANNSFGLGAMIAGATGAVTGGPVGGIAMGLAGKLIKDRGDMLAADLLSRAAKVAGVTGLVARSDARLAKGVAALVGSKVETVGALAAPKASGGFISTLLKDAKPAAELGTVAGVSEMRMKFSKRADAINTLTTNPAALSEKVGAMLGPVADASPKVAAATTAKVLGDLQFLASKLPPTRRDQYSLQPQFQPPTRASDAEIAQHERYVQALDNPTIVLDLARKGTLTPDHVEAVKERYPKMYEEMRVEVFKGLAGSKTEVSYARRIQLGILLDLPTDKTLAPDFVQAVQATYSAAEKAGQEPPPPQFSQLDVAGSLATGTQNAMSEGKEW